MGLRFRRSWGVFPGVRLNLGLKSGSVSFGVRGLHYTVGTRGSQVTAGLPGTGLFWTQKIKSPFGNAQAGSASQPPSYLQPTTARSPPVRVWNPVPQSGAPQNLHAPQLPRLNQSPMQQPAASGAAQSASATISQVFVPVWLVWAVLAVIAIGALCFVAAAVGQHLR